MTFRHRPLPGPDSENLEALRAVLGDEAVEDALRFFPTPERETEAMRAKREREAAERTAEHLTMKETRDAIQAGKYGTEAKAKLAEEIAQRGDANDPAVLRFAAKLANDQRKAEFYRRQSAAAKDTK